MGTDQARSDATVPAVHRAVDILELLARQPKLTMNEIRLRLNLPKSSTFNLLKALEERDLVERDAETGRYTLGLNLVYLGGAMQDRADVRQMAIDEMRRLVDATQETSHLAVLDRRTMEIMYIEKIDSPQWIKLASYVGRRNPAYCTAVGKALLAYLDPPDLETYLHSHTFRQFTPNTLVEPDAVRAELHRVRAQGYAIDNEEHEPGVRCVAAPIRDKDHRVVAAISISALTMRLASERLPEVVELVRAAGASVSRRLGSFSGY